MKKLLQLSLLVLFSVVSFNVNATTLDDEKIDLEGGHEGTDPRSVVVPAKAWFNSDAATVKLQVTSRDGYAIVTITDAMGLEVCSESVIANGTIQHIVLPSYTPSEVYSLTVEYDGVKRTGEFY